MKHEHFSSLANLSSVIATTIHPPCDSSQFQCKGDGMCIPSSAVCDGHFDCADYSDENMCDGKYTDIASNPGY